MVPPSGLFLHAPQLAIRRQMIMIQRTKRYCSQLSWLVRHMGRRGTLMALGSLGFQFIGVAGLGAFLLALYGYLNHRNGTEGSDALLAAVYQLPPAAAIGLFFLIGIIGTTLLYIGEWLAIRISRHLHPRHAALATRCMLSKGSFEAVQKQYASATRTRMLSISPRYAAISTRRLVGVFAPMLAAGGGIASLFLLSWQSTTILAGCGAVFAIFLSRLNLKAARLQHAYHDNSGSTSHRCRDAMAEADRNGAVPDLDVLERDIDDCSDAHRELDALYGRMLVLRTSNFLNTNFMVIAICLITGTMIMVFNGQDWSLLLSYLVMLRVAATGIKQLSGVMVTISRYFPEVEKLQIADSTCRQNGELQIESNSALQSGLASMDDDEIDE